MTTIIKANYEITFIGNRMETESRPVREIGIQVSQVIDFGKTDFFRIKYIRACVWKFGNTNSHVTIVIFTKV